MSHRLPLPVLLLALIGLRLAADTLVLKDGKELTGTFLGGNARQVEFLPESGRTVKVPVDTVRTLAFATEAEVATRPASPAPVRSVVIPAGTPFRVRTIDAIDVDTTQAGAKFRAGIDDPIMLGGDVIVPRGADVILVASKVKQGGRMKGSDLVELKVQSISVGGRSRQVVTSLADAKSGGEGSKTARKIIGGAGLGAIIGGIAGGGKGAAIGAAAGGAGGTAIAASGQPHLKVPPETRLEFQLLSDWKLP
jgi:hypothetical protein